MNKPTNSRLFAPLMYKIEFDIKSPQEKATICEKIIRKTERGFLPNIPKKHHYMGAFPIYISDTVYKCHKTKETEEEEAMQNVMIFIEVKQLFSKKQAREGDNLRIKTQDDISCRNTENQSAYCGYTQ